MTHPIVIAHRGASGYLPEHTLAAYFMAVEQGADYIEPDLVVTRDGVLIARHENEISQTTDVALHAEFAERKRSKVIDGENLTGWFTEDFTLAEIKRLRAVERIPKIRPLNSRYDRMFEIPTLEEILELAHRLKVRRGSGEPVGVYPETKHPSYFHSLGLAQEKLLVETLHRFGFSGRAGRAFIQSFETDNLKALRSMTDLPLVQLMDGAGQPWDARVRKDSLHYADMLHAQGLRDVAAYADAIGVYKNLLIPRTDSNKLSQPSTVVSQAHAAGLKVHAWTFRAENSFLPAELRSGNDDAGHGNLMAEIARFLALGVDGVFSDHPDVAVAARATKTAW